MNAGANYSTKVVKQLKITLLVKNLRIQNHRNDFSLDFVIDGMH